MREIRKADDHELVDKEDAELVPGMATLSQAAEEEEQKKLLKASFIAKSMTVVLTLALLILWPMPMYGTGYVFSEKFFTGWVVVGILWLFCSIFMVGLYPIFEGRHSLKHNIVSIFKDITGKEHPAKHHTSAAIFEGKDASGANTPPVESEKVAESKTVPI
jgi:Ca2+/H+ antiporter